MLCIHVFVCARIEENNNNTTMKCFQWQCVNGKASSNGVNISTIVSVAVEIY